jgi:hypothetical protein
MRTIQSQFFLLTALAASAAMTCFAGAVTVTNPGFEDPTTGVGTVSVPTGWQNSATAATYNPYEFRGDNDYYIGANSTSDPANGGSGYPGISGENLGYDFNGAAGDGLSQQLAATLQAGTSYTLTVTELARNGLLPSTFAGSEIDLLAGDTVIASAVDNAGPTPGTAADQVAFLADSDTVAALIGQQLTVRLTTTLAYTGTNNIATDWDNVRLDAESATPEPGGAIPVVLGLGLAGILGWRKRS